MADPLKLSQLSCSRCKERKVKCNRIIPKCGRCEIRRSECIYPNRCKRKPVGQSGGHSSMDSTLATILEKLQRVEDKCTKLQPSTYSSLISSAKHTVTTEPLVHQNATTSLSAESRSNLVGPSSPWSLDPSPGLGYSDAASLLQSAVDEVERRVLRQVTKSVVTDVIHIPKKLARTWVEAFFEYMRTDMFVSLIDRKLIELMPELVEMDHVHIDGSITFVYYTVLYLGCSITASTTNPADMQYCKAAYICCLRALPGWQREATGSTTDLIAALSMFMICAESFNLELGWQMYKLACDYTRSLNLQSLDVYDSPSTWQERTSDGNRKGFWELVQIDLFLQLIFDKPPSITSTTWKVNMPWLDPDSQPKEKVVATLFLSGSRVTLILMRFFSLLETTRDGSRTELIQETEILCQEIQELYNQGRLGKCLLGSAQSEADIWKMIDATLIGYTCIIFMLRKARMHGLNSPIPSVESELVDSPIALDAARNIIETSEWLLARYPWSTSVAALFGAFKIHIAYTMLINAACQAPDVAAYAADIRMLQSLGESIIKISSTEKELTPLVCAVRSLNTHVKQKYDQNKLPPL